MREIYPQMTQMNTDKTDDLYRT